MQPDCLQGLEPEVWHVVFWGASDSAWVNRLVPGRFKHVSAFGRVGACGVWIFVNPTFARLQLALVPEGKLAAAAMSEWLIEGNEAVSVPAKRDGGAALRPLFSCVSAIAHITGVRSCALRPDAFRRDCLANGGEPVGARRSNGVSQA